MFAIFCEEGGACPEVDSTPNHVTITKSWTIWLAYVLRREDVAVVAMVAPGLWLPARCSGERHTPVAKADTDRGAILHVSLDRNLGIQQPLGSLIMFPCR
jgi:hypothetical protein